MTTKFKLQCSYCGTEDLLSLWEAQAKEACAKCGDKNLLKSKVEIIDFYGSEKQQDAYIKPSKN